MALDLGHERVGDGSAAEHEAVLRSGAFAICLEQQIIGESQFHSLVGIHPGLGIHEVADLGTGQAGLDLVGIDDAFLDFGEHIDCLLHLLAVTDSNRQGVVDHHERRGRHEHLCTSHRNDGCGRGGNAVDLDRDVTVVVHQHIVDLGGCHAVPTGRVDPDGDIPGAGHQLILEKLRRDIIVKPALLSDRAV